MKKMILLISASLFVVSMYGQKYGERRFIRRGNSLYQSGDYANSDIAYRRALERAPESVEANFNLADVLYKQGNFKEAQQMFENLSKMPDSPHKQAAFYNLGNSLFEQREFEKAIEAYKSALRINPADTNAKFNLAYAQKMLENKDKDKDKDKDNNKDKDKDKQDQKDDSQNKPKEDPKDGDDKDAKPEPQEQPKEGQMSKQDAQQMLDAMQDSEDKTREKVDKQKPKYVGKSGKNW